MNSIFKVIVSSYLSNRFRSCLVVLALIAATAGLSSVLILNETAKQSYRVASKPLVSNVSYRVTPKPGTSLTKEHYVALRKAGVVNIVPVAVKRFWHTDEQSRKVLFTLFGVDSFALLNQGFEQQDSLVNSTSQVFSQLWSPQGVVLIHQRFAQEQGLSEKQQLTTENGQTLPPLALIKSEQMGRELITDIAIFQQLFNTEKLSELWLTGVLSDQDITKIQNLLPNHLNLQKTFDQGDAKQLEGSFHLNILAMALLMFAVCMFVVMNAFNLLFARRLDNFKVLRQLGVHRSALLRASLIELLVLCLITAPIGFLIGQFGAQLLAPEVSRTLQGLYGAQINFIDAPITRILAYCFIASLIGAGMAAFLPLWTLNNKLSRKQTIVFDSKHNKTLAWFTGAVLTTALSFVVYEYFSGLRSSFVVIGALLLAGCMMMIAVLPNIMSGALSLIPQRYYMLRYATSNSLVISDRSKIAFCAFFIAVATNVGMNLMVDSFRQATDHWLKQRLNADAYVMTQAPDQFLRLLSQIPSQGILIPRREIQASLFDKQKVTVRFRPQGQRFEQGIVLDEKFPDAWKRFNQGESIFVNQQLYLSQRLSLGQTLTINLADLGQRQFTLAGVFIDYGNPDFQAMLPASLWPEGRNSASVYALFDWQVDSLDRLEKLFEENNTQISLLRTAELKNLSMSTFDRTFIITDSLNIVTLLVAAFSLASSMLILNLDERPKHALMRSMGFAKQRLFLSSLGQYSMLALLVCLMAIPAGMGLSWLLINLVNVQAFFWRYPLVIDWSVIYVVITTSLFLVVAVLLLPIFKDHSRKLTEDLKWLN